ncbi:MAG: histidine kinase dimerization/phospho-acceptor domain-containing protein [Chthoniobacteraceae bacterium]
MKSLRTGLLLRLLLGGGLLLVAVTFVLKWQVEHLLLEEFDSALLATAKSLATQVEQKRSFPIGHGRLSVDYGDTFPQYGHVNSGEFFALYTDGGLLLQVSPSLGRQELFFHSDSREQPSAFDLQLSPQMRVRALSLPFSVNDEEDDEHSATAPPHAVLIVARDRHPMDHAIEVFQWILWSVGGLSLLAFAGLVHWSVRGGLRLVDRLGHEVAAMDVKSLHHRFALDPLVSELRPIAAALNQLLARLESTFARESRFTATAAHELRTPLAELRSLADVNLTTPGTEAERVECWQDVLSTARRMESLTTRLLDLTRTENAGQVLEFQPVELATAIAKAWPPCQPIAEKRGLIFAPKIPPGLSLTTDETLFGVILSNLCTNAARYALAGSVFTIEARVEEDGICLLFANQSDLAADEVPLLFERFWRKDSARTASAHFGLGLSLAREFAHLLQGELTAKLLPPSQLQFTLMLPKAATPQGRSA